MGMDAHFTVNGKYIDAYKCRGIYSHILSVCSVAVSYSFEYGYGFPYLYVFFLDVASKEIYKYRVDEPDVIVEIKIPKHLGHNIEVFIKMDYDLPFPEFQHFTKYNIYNAKARAIRRNPQKYVNNMTCVEDVFDFVGAFVKIDAKNPGDIEVDERMYLDNKALVHLDYTNIAQRLYILMNCEKSSHYKMITTFLSAYVM